MGVFYETVPPSLREWIPKQKMFWVATAPLSSSGHINVSPKGGQYFGLKDERTFWYMDISGSGIETIAHLYEPGNARITIMFSEFVGAPKIVRLWGRGRVLERGTKEYDAIVAEEKIETIDGTRSIIVVDVHQVGSSCGFSVPYYEFKEFRTTLNKFYENKAAKYAAGNEAEALDKYWALKNSFSVDHLPGVKQGLDVMKRDGITPLKKMVGPHAPIGYARREIRLIHVMMIAILSLFAGIIVSNLGLTVIPEVYTKQMRELVRGLGS